MVEIVFSLYISHYIACSYLSFIYLSFPLFPHFPIKRGENSPWLFICAISTQWGSQTNLQYSTFGSLEKPTLFQL